MFSWSWRCHRATLHKEDFARDGWRDKDLSSGPTQIDIEPGKRCSCINLWEKIPFPVKRRYRYLYTQKYRSWGNDSVYKISASEAW